MKNTRGDSHGWETAPRCPSLRPSHSIPRLTALVRKRGPDSPRRCHVGWAPNRPMRIHGVEESNLPQAIKLRQGMYRGLTIKFCGARWCWRGCDNVPVSVNDTVSSHRTVTVGSPLQLSWTGARGHPLLHQGQDL